MLIIQFVCDPGKYRTMALFGTKLRLLAKSKLGPISAGVTYFLLFGLIPTGILLTAYVLFYTKYWYIALGYLIWIVIDRHTPNEEGRVNNWVQSWTLFKYTTNYFPINVHIVPGLVAQPKKNYLACAFPHGILPTGAIMAFLTNSWNVKEKIPYHKIFGVALNGLFYVPFYRDFILSIGLIKANSSCIERRLNDRSGGNIVGIIIGGSAEMFHCRSEEYKIVLNKRRGFIRIALRTGAPLVPVFAFGETSIYKQKVFPEGSLGRRLQHLSKLIIGFPIILFYGRGVFQKTFGFIPLQAPINVVVGMPIDVEKIENPAQEDVDALHKIFVEKLVALFEEYKYQFEQNPTECKLIIC